MLAIGQPVPAFSAYDQYNEKVHSHELEDNPWVLFFLPQTFGREGLFIMNTLHEHMLDFDELEVLIMGFSPITDYIHSRNSLTTPFPLIYDEKGTIGQAFGIYDGTLYQPSCFLTDRMGTLLWQQVPLQQPNFIEELLKAVRKHCS